MTEIIVGAAILFVIVTGLLLRLFGSKVSVAPHQNSYDVASAVTQVDTRHTPPATPATPPKPSIAEALVKLDRPNPSVLVAPASAVAVTSPVAAVAKPVMASVPAPVSPPPVEAAPAPIVTAQPPAADLVILKSEPLRPSVQATLAPVVAPVSERPAAAVTAPPRTEVKPTDQPDVITSKASQTSTATIAEDYPVETWSRFEHLRHGPFSQPKNRSSSIWSASLRRADPIEEMAILDLFLGSNSVRAERLPVRAGTRLVGRGSDESRLLSTTRESTRVLS